MLYDGSLKHVSISPLVASYYIEATERGSATARNRLGCVPTTVQRGQMTVSYRQCYRLSRPLAATAMPGDRVARPATSTARRGRRTTVATASAGTITPMRPRRTRDRTQRTADQSGRTGGRTPIATPPVDAVQAGAPLRHRYGNHAFRPVQRDQRLVLHGQAACTREPGTAPARPANRPTRPPIVHLRPRHVNSAHRGSCPSVQRVAPYEPAIVRAVKAKRLQRTAYCTARQASCTQERTTVL